VTLSGINVAGSTPPRGHQRGKSLPQKIKLIYRNGRKSTAEGGSPPQQTRIGSAGDPGCATHVRSKHAAWECRSADKSVCTTQSSICSDRQPTSRIYFRYIFAYAVGVERARKTRGFPSAVEVGFGQDIQLEKLEEALSQLEFTKDGSLTGWAAWRLQRLAEFHLGPGIKKLASAGIRRETIAFGMYFVTISAPLDLLLKDLFGGRRTRMRDAMALERAAGILRRMSDALPNLPEMMKSLPSFALTARALEAYCVMLVWGEAASTITGVGSCQEMAKYSLASVVKRVSGKFHDREVSAMTGAALGNYDYDETAHRVWRIRTYDRLERSFPLAPMALQALNNVMQRQ